MRQWRHQKGGPFVARNYVLRQPERYTFHIDQSDRGIGTSDILSSLAIPLQLKLWICLTSHVWWPFVLYWWNSFVVQYWRHFWLTCSRTLPPKEKREGTGTRRLGIVRLTEAVWNRFCLSCVMLKLKLKGKSKFDFISLNLIVVMECHILFLVWSNHTELKTTMCSTLLW